MNAIDGNKVELETFDEDEDEEDSVYVEYDITTYPSDFTLSIIREMWKEGDIIVPPFQRNYVWNIKQASMLVESFLLGLPVPQVFFYIDDETGENLVIDGQQRIQSIVYFFEGHWGKENAQGKQRVFRLTGLDKKSPYSGKTYSELSQADQRKFSNGVLRALNIRQMAPKGDNTSVYHIFERLNTGGTTLKAQEIRNCVFRGEMVKELRELNENVSWRKILGKEAPDNYQKDIEVMLRVFAFSKFHEAEYEKPMKEFLNKAMSFNKDADKQGWKKFKEVFPEVCDLIVRELGEKPFHVRGPLNVSVMDSVFSSLINNPRKVSDDFGDKYKSLVKDEAYELATQKSTSDASVVKERFEMVRERLLSK